MSFNKKHYYILLISILSCGFSSVLSQSELPNLKTKAIVTNITNNIQKIEIYYSNGKLMETGFFLWGEKHGIWEQWDELGNLIGKASYVNGDKEGIWNSYYKNGQKRYYIEYKKDRLSYVNHWDDKGNQLEEREYASVSPSW